MNRAFTLEYWRDDDWYIGRLREIPNCVSQGESLDDLEGNIRDAYELLRADQEVFAPGRHQLGLG